MRFNMLERYTNEGAESFTYAGNVISMTRNAYTKQAIVADKYINSNLALNGKANLYYLQDELGSTMYMTGTDGIAFDAYAYDEFGRNLGSKICENNTWSSKRKSYSEDGNIIKPFAFTGYQYDEISENYFAQARYYDAENGRFTAEDQVRGYIDVPDTLNHYLYCLNNPIIFIDLTGLFLEYIMRGKEAHELLQNYLEELYPNNVRTEYYINSGMPTISGTGRADIVYFNRQKNIAEVYEIKPGRYAKWPIRQIGLYQLNNYINALSNNGQLEKYGISDVKSGYSLDEVINSYTVESIAFPGEEIVYNVYENDGLVTYYYRKKKTTNVECVEETEKKEQKNVFEEINTTEVTVVAGAAMVAVGVVMILDDFFTFGASVVNDGVGFSMIVKGLSVVFG